MLIFAIEESDLRRAVSFWLLSHCLRIRVLLFEWKQSVVMKLSPLHSHVEERDDHTIIKTSSGRVIVPKFPANAVDILSLITSSSKSSQLWRRRVLFGPRSVYEFAPFTLSVSAITWTLVKPFEELAAVVTPVYGFTNAGGLQMVASCNVQWTAYNLVI